MSIPSQFLQYIRASAELGPYVLPSGILKIAFSCWLLQYMFVSVELGPYVLSHGIL